MIPPGQGPVRRTPERGAVPRRPARRNRAGLLLLSCAAWPGLWALPAGISAQLRVGGHFVHAAESFGGASGVGLRAGVAIPLLPLDVMASWARFSPECPPGEPDCGLTGLTLDANFRIPVPLVRPYLSGGIAYRSLDPVDPGDDGGVLGPGLGAGAEVALARLRLFGEARYEWVDAPEDQLLWRLGVLFDLL